MDRMYYSPFEAASLVPAFWIAFVASALLAYPIWQLLIRLRSRQTVSEYAPETHQVKQGTPTMGGIILVAGSFLSLAYFAIEGSNRLPFQESDDLRGPNLPLIAAVLLVGFALIGFIDDFLVPRLIKGKRGLGWKQKILMQLVIAGAASWIFTGGAFDFRFVVSIFLILFFSNAYNFSDGLDALSGTLLLGLCLGLGGIAIAVHDVSAALVVAPLAASAIPFLYLNAPPAKVFMGDVGSLPIGAVLGLVAVDLASTFRIVPQGDFQVSYIREWSWIALAPVAIASLMMVAELVPVPLQILSVKLFKRKLFPYTPIHHAFEKAGWKETRVVGMFALTQLVLSLIAISLAFFWSTPGAGP